MKLLNTNKKRRPSVCETAGQRMSKMGYDPYILH